MDEQNRAFQWPTPENLENQDWSKSDKTGKKDGILFGKESGMHTNITRPKVCALCVISVLLEKYILSIWSAWIIKIAEPI